MTRATATHLPQLMLAKRLSKNIPSLLRGIAGRTMVGTMAVAPWIIKAINVKAVLDEIEEDAIMSAYFIRAPTAEHPGMFPLEFRWVPKDSPEGRCAEQGKTGCSES